jgi:hypothetical protein
MTAECRANQVVGLQIDVHVQVALARHSGAWGLTFVPATDAYTADQ